MAEKSCPVAGCGTPVAPGKFMCRSHWFRLPKPLRDEVWRTWRVVQLHRKSEKSGEEKIRDIQTYRSARADAEAYHRD